MQVNQFKNGLSLVVLGLVLTPVAAYADSWTCTQNNTQREVKVEYTGDGPVPCNVVYDKSDEGAGRQIPWSASSAEGFCEEKAQGLVTKLESSGWSCENTAASAPGAPAGADEPLEEMEQSTPGEQVEQTSPTPSHEMEMEQSDSGDDMHHTTTGDQMHQTSPEGQAKQAE